MVTLDLFAIVSGTNGVNDEGFQLAQGAIISSGGLLGNLSGGPVSPFNSSGFQNGSQQDLDADGDLDIGVAPNGGTPTTGYFVARSATMQTRRHADQRQRRGIPHRHVHVRRDQRDRGNVRQLRPPRQCQRREHHDGGRLAAGRFAEEPDVFANVERLAGAQCRLLRHPLNPPPARSPRRRWRASGCCRGGDAPNPISGTR
jgi:hypothetical protein